MNRRCSRALAGRLAKFLVLLSFFAATGATAGGVERLQQFMSRTQTAQGEFAQRIYDHSGRVTQESSGRFAFSRPGKFRWTYEKPYAQLIVGDGARIWIYDEDLQQVTVRKLDQALGSTPAALLAGSNEALKGFELKDEGVREGLEWVLAVPREQESNFSRIRMGFSEAGLAAMELADSFGQTTVLTFDKLRRNPALDPELFKFTPPEGADLIGAIE
ncbi:MAG TPA: outer membrane lipoprotein chaperone LolA [Burkholderiales bacterium]|nr:outer membrane lipoprotein chaperone LolA [Burkholderiales bacterium]